jgi:hypothetical protein
MRDVPTYATVGGPPADWAELDVYRDGGLVEGCVEVNTVEGWAIIHKHDAHGRPVVKDGLIEQERVEGHFSLVWRAGGYGPGDPDE